MSDSLHTLLIRHLQQSDLAANKMPTDPEQWKLFLDKINRNYFETVHDHHLPQCFIDISSLTLSALNEKLQNPEHLARIGHWQRNFQTGHGIWSKEMYAVIGYNPEQTAPTYEDYLNAICEEDRERYDALVKRALTEGKNYDIEVKIFHRMKSEYRWIFAAGFPEKNSDTIISISGIVMDITQRKEVETQIAELNRQLLIAARRAGREEVATSVLHNVGNVLNSVNVSAELVLEKLQRTRIKKLDVAMNMLLDHLPNLKDYLANDEKGKLLPGYLKKTIQTLKNDNEEMNQEVRTFHKHLTHIKQIVEMQQSLSGISGLAEKFSLRELMDSSLQMSGLLLNKSNITITTEYDDTPPLFTDKSKLLQILINLLQNARDAVTETSQPDKKIQLLVKKFDDDAVDILVSDNGIGIQPENLNRIFSFGFTTKTQGHGFGLHSSAIAANEIGATLQVRSEGIGQGAIFKITLPIAESR